VLVVAMIAYARGALPWVMVLAAAACAIVIAEKWIAHFHVVARKFTRGQFSPSDTSLPLSARAQETLAYLDAEAQGNTSVYSGFSPFVGSGVNLGAFSFALDVTKPAGNPLLGRAAEVRTFSAQEVYEHLSSSLFRLQIDGLRIEDRLYVSGQHIRDDTRFLSHPLARPATRVADAIADDVAEHPSLNVRFYKRIRVVDWSGEVVLSIFVRFLRSAESLFVEVSYLVLPPVQESYHFVDRVRPDATVHKRIEILMLGLMQTPFAALGAPFGVMGVLLEPVARAWRGWWSRRAILNNPAFDYGAQTTIRQISSSPNYREYFQKLDQEMYLKTIERRILDSLIDFLDERNIDTSDLKERQLAILNSGVIVAGGNVTARSMTVGDQAKSVVMNVARRARTGTHG
jgi:hypothetical protein